MFNTKTVCFSSILPTNMYNTKTVCFSSILPLSLTWSNFHTFKSLRCKSTFNVFIAFHSARTKPKQTIQKNKDNDHKVSFCILTKTKAVHSILIFLFQESFFTQPKVAQRTDRVQLKKMSETPDSFFTTVIYRTIKQKNNTSNLMNNPACVLFINSN